MGLLIAWLIKFLVFAGFLYILSKLFEDFILDIKGLWGVAGLLFLMDISLRYLLQVLAFPINLISFYLLNFLVVWIINIIILYVTDKISQALEIKSGVTLIISGALLSVARMVSDFIGKVF